MREYYRTLGVSRGATTEEIQRAFRWLGVKNHPDRATDVNKVSAQMEFEEVCEAFDVLSDPQRRSIYDQYGEKGLRVGVRSATGALIGGNYFRPSAESIYQKFFGTHSVSGGPATLNGLEYPVWSQHQPRAAAQPLEDDVHASVSVTLAQILKRDTVFVEYKRRRLSGNGTSSFEEIKKINLTPTSEWENGCKIRLSKQGNENVARGTGDLIVSVTVVANENYCRENFNLVYLNKVFVLDVLLGHTATVPLLNKSKSLSVAVAGPEGKEVVVSNEGFLRPDGSRGNLVVRTVPVFPTQLSSKQMELLRQANHQ